MSKQQTRPTDSGYSFDCDFPTGVVEEGKSILIRGPSQSERKGFILDLLKSSSGRVVDPTAVVTTDDPGVEWIRRYNMSVDNSNYQPPLGVVDCVADVSSYPTDQVTAASVHSPDHLSDIGMETTDMIESIANRGFDHLRLVFDSVCQVVGCTDTDTLFRFFRLLTGLVKSTSSLGLFTIDPELHDREFLLTIDPLFDYVIDVNEKSTFGITNFERIS